MLVSINCLLESRYNFRHLKHRYPIQLHNFQINRSINMIVLRLCEHTNPNNFSVSIFKLLTKYQGSDPDGRVIQLIRKCIIKHTDTVVLDKEKNEQLDVIVIFQLIYEFCFKFYSETASDSIKESMKPIKNYLQRIVLTKRYKVWKILNNEWWIRALNVHWIKFRC